LSAHISKNPKFRISW